MLWVKACHIIAVVCWFSGLFYLPRLFVYHAMSEDQVSKDRFVVMERKLYRGIATPSAIATVVFGLWLLSYNPAYYMSSWWMQVKLLLVLVAIVYHFMCGRYLKKFRDEEAMPSHKFFRAFNEFPVFLLIPIVILIVVKP